MKKHILIIVAHEFQKRIFDPYSEHYLLHWHVLDATTPVMQQSAAVLAHLAAHSIQLDGVFGISDETSVLASLIVENCGLPGALPQAIAHIQHKEEFARICCELDQTYCPTLIATHDNYSNLAPQSFPVFFKPSKGSLSRGTGIAHSKKELQQALKTALSKPNAYSDWFAGFFARYLPTISGDAHSFLVQKLHTGRQFTLDGYVHNGVVHTVGITESCFDAEYPSFTRFEYPATITDSVLEELLVFLHKLFERTQFDNSAFNVEFFVESDSFFIIECNTRVSAQFFAMFDTTFTIPYSRQLIELALGAATTLTRKKSVASMTILILRRDTDAMVTKVPTPQETQSLYDQYPEIMEIKVFAQNNQRLSAVMQDPFSFRYASVMLHNKQAPARRNHDKITHQIRTFFSFI